MLVFAFGFPHMNRERVLAWCVHIFTASGIVPAFFAIVAISEKDYLMAFLMLMVAHFIDGVDGTLARRARVTEVLPHMSGKMMDSVIDFSTYAIIPAYAMYMAPDFWPAIPYLKEASVVLILMVSTLYYGKEGMVSNDYYFVGFPVLWNWVAFYLYYIFEWNSWGNVALIWICAILHFVPFKYVYPSRSKELMHLNVSLMFVMLFSCLLTMLIAEKVIMMEHLYVPSRIISIIILLYFIVVGLFFTKYPKENR